MFAVLLTVLCIPKVNIQAARKNASEVKELKAIIKQQNEAGAWMMTDLDGNEYTWKNGRLIEIDWAYAGLKGSLDLGKFKELKKLTLMGLYEVSNLDVSKNTKLEYLRCHDLAISNLNLSKNTRLQELNCTETQISELDLRKNVKLTKLVCSNNKMNKLNLSKNSN